MRTVGILSEASQTHEDGCTQAVVSLLPRKPGFNLIHNGFVVDKAALVHLGVRRFSLCL
jgi:hypothetical protein